MTLIRFQQTIEIEHNTDTGKSRVLKNYARPLGKGMTIKKDKVKKLTPTQVELNAESIEEDYM